MGVIYNERLLTRDQFREFTFERDKHTCVLCRAPAQDAHHILERRLWGETQGYYLSNGASVCGPCHIKCEQTTISVQLLRDVIGIDKWSIPSHLYADETYDKWGNIILPSGQRVKGELFFDESVQKILKEGGVLGEFVDYVKYPRTHHLPWSPGLTDDDRVIKDLSAFDGKRVIVTVKMDGENTNLYQDHYHARSVDSKSHPSRDWAKAKWAKFAYDIPKGWRICCENLYAKHSIHYTDLPDYLMGFSVWDDRNVCQSWDDTLFMLEYFGIIPVPVLYDGIWDEKKIKALWNDSMWDNVEGYVVRVADSFTYGQFRTHVAKFVRKGHVQTSKHWMRGQPITPNQLK